MKRALILLSLVVLFNLVVEAQSTGYRGNRFAIKTNLISGVQFRTVTLETEFAAARMISLTMGLNAQQFNADVSSDIDNDYRLSTEPTRSALATLGFRIYPNRIIPAPQGFYLSMEFGVGIERHSFEYTNKATDVSGVARKASIFGHTSTPSFGYQAAVGKRWLLDFKYATEAYYVYDDSEYNYKFLRTNLGSVRVGPVIFGSAFYVKLGLLLF